MKSGQGVFCSRNRLIIIGVVWVFITVTVGLLAGLLSTHACSDEEEITTAQPGSTTTTQATTTSPIPGQPWTDPFLSDVIRPVHYELWFYPDFYYDGDTFMGRENVTIEVGEETQYLVIHYKLMNITDTMVWYEDGTEVAVTRAFAYEDNQYWVVECQDVILASSTVILHLEFEGSLVNGIVGYYKSTYVNSLTGVER